MIKEPWWKKYNGVIAFLTVFSVAVLFSALFLPEAPVWITDNGNKLMITRNFLDKGTIFFDHVSPENFPCGGFHFQHLADGRISSFHSPCLPVLTAWCCNFAGTFAYTLLPILSLAGIAWLLSTFPGRKKYLLLAALATPLSFYGVQFWEMVPAAFFVTLAAWFYSRRQIEYAGFAFACGLWMREELYLLGLALLIVLIFQKQWKEIVRFGTGALLPVIALWVSNTLLFDNIFGLHGATYWGNNRPEFSLIAQIKEIFFNFYQHLIRFETLPAFSGILAFFAILTALTAGLLPDYRKFRKFRITAGIIFTAISLILSIGLLKEKQYLLVSAKTFGLFLSIPAVAPVLFNIRNLLTDKQRMVRLAAGILLIYTLLIPFMLNPHDIGLTWGARHFIMVMPLMIWLAIYAFTRNGFFLDKTRWIFTSLAISGIFLQLYALNALIKVTTDTENFQNEILSLEAPVVVSDLFFIPEMTPDVPFEKIHLEVASARQLETALVWLEMNNIKEIILILSPDYRQISNESLAKLLSRYTAVMKPENRSFGNSINVMYTILRRK